MKNYILGLSAYYHDSAAALICDGEVVAAAQEERFTRKKHDPAFPTQAVKYCLQEAGITHADIQHVVFYDKPLLKFERLLETYLSYTPSGFRSFLTAMPIWLKDKLFLKKTLKRELSAVFSITEDELPSLLFNEHHQSHAASAFFPSPYEKAAVLCLDGVGEWATTSMWLGDGHKLTPQWEIDFPHSLGLLYSAFTYYTGFRVNSGEYKLMGLAPYGNPDAERVQRFIKIIKENLIDIKADGSIFLDQQYFNYATGLRMVHDKKWEKLFGIPKRAAESEFEQVHCDLGMAIQNITEEVVMKMAAEAKRLTDADTICLAGGVALNCVANGKLQKSGIFKEYYIQPAAGDAGGALGAAQAAHFIYFGSERKMDGVTDAMSGSYLGPEYSGLDIELMSKKFDGVYKKIDDFKLLCDEVAVHLDKGNAIGWMQGRMEFGPRALGARSILGDPRNPEMQKKLNLKIKYRESFRPFAPSVLDEDAKDYFELEGTSPYMLLVQDVVEKRRNELPANYGDLPIKEKLYYLRSDLPAITHIDFSARIQTVHKDTNPRYHELLSSFKEATGCSVLVNTSFNVRGEPIVCTPEDAYRCFMRTEMDFLVIGNYLFEKTKQPEWQEKDKWQEQFVLD